MKTLKVRDINSSLKKKGFEVAEGRKHKFYHLIIAGKKTSIRTHVSHGEVEVDEFLISSMKNQTKLKKSEFIDLINCPLSKESYIELLKERGHISL